MKRCNQDELAAITKNSFHYSVAREPFNNFEITNVDMFELQI